MHAIIDFILTDTSYLFQATLLSAFLLSLIIIVAKWMKLLKKPEEVFPISVNYFFTRKCNLSCGFCFYVEKTSIVTLTEDAKRGMLLLKEAGMKKVNFAGYVSIGHPPSPFTGTNYLQWRTLPIS
jgi:hypothetical protein